MLSIEDANQLIAHLCQRFVALQARLNVTDLQMAKLMGITDDEWANIVMQSRNVPM